MKLTRNGLLTAILVIAALFIGSFIAERMPQPDRIVGEQPFYHAVEVGEQATLRTAEVTVTGVQTAKRVERFGQVAESAGVWLVVDVEWDPRDAPSTLQGSTVMVRASDGRRFGDLQVVFTSCGPTQPGIPVACQIAIEIAPDALEGARSLIPAEGSVGSNDDVALVDLGIDADEAAALSETDADLVLLESTAVVR